MILKVGRVRKKFNAQRGRLLTVSVEDYRVNTLFVLEMFTTVDKEIGVVHVITVQKGATATEVIITKEDYERISEIVDYEAKALTALWQKQLTNS